MAKIRTSDPRDLKHFAQLGPNPFPVGHPRHRIWTDVERTAKEEITFFHSKMLRELPAEVSPRSAFVEFLADFAGGIYDIYADNFSVFFPRTDDGAQWFEQCLDAIATYLLAKAKLTMQEPNELSEIQIRLNERRLFWVGTMLHAVRTAQPKPEPISTAAPATTPAEPPRAESRFVCSRAREDA